MDNRTKASNLVRAFNLAGAIVAADESFVGAADAGQIAEAVGQLSDTLYALQNEKFEAEGLGEDTRPPSGKKSSGGWKGSSAGSSSSEEATFKQKAFVRRLLDGAGRNDVDVDALSKSEASELIQELQG